MNVGTAHRAADKETSALWIAYNLVLFGPVDAPGIFIKGNKVSHVIWGKAENH